LNAGPPEWTFLPGGAWRRAWLGAKIMDWYLYTKLFHIVFAAFWIGGGVAMILLGAAAAFANDDRQLVRVVQQVVFLSERFFIPSSLLTVILGAAMVWMAHSFSDLWIVLGLAGFAATFVTGVAIIRPMAVRVASIVAGQGETPEAAALCRRILRTACFDYIAILLVAAVMVLKPTADDVALLSTFAAILVASAIWFIGLPRRAVAA
jgi:uncharacterized membrane protein